jgi:hypothetical protein
VHVAVDDEPGVVGLHVAEDVEATDMEVVGVRWKGRRFLPPFHRYLDTSGKVWGTCRCRRCIGEGEVEVEGEKSSGKSDERKI